MALPGQRFNLDLDSDDWKFDVEENEQPVQNAVSNIKERSPIDIPAPPTIKSTRTGFPEHRPKKQSAFKQRQEQQNNLFRGPSDAAILHQAAKSRGVDLSTAKQKANIDAENRSRVANMSMDELEEARSELLSQFNPDKLRAFLGRANANDDTEKQQKDWTAHEEARPEDTRKTVSFDTTKSMDQREVETTNEGIDDDASFIPTSTSSTHFPGPPRNKADFQPLDPSSETFLTDLKQIYFPNLTHDESSLSWLRDPSDKEASESNYNPSRTGFAPSALRFDFKGALIPPYESLEIPTSKGLHHHGDAPHSAGYTIPELTLLARSSLPNQRCVAYQVIGRVLYRLGKGEFGPRGQEMNEGLWTCVEKERVVEIVMAEANRDGKGTHQSAKAYAVEALWLWRRGGGGERGVLKENERRAD